jgi:hypothetical protein
MQTRAGVGLAVGSACGPRSFLNMKYYCLVICALVAGWGRSLAQGTAFSHQGHLDNYSSPANGIYDFRFEGGLALATIQGLDQKVESENQALRAENAELRIRLERIEQALSQKTESNE